MKILDEQLCKMISGAYYLNIFSDGFVQIGSMHSNDCVTINNLQLTDHGYFDLQGNKIHPYTVNGFKIIDGYQIQMLYKEYSDVDSGSSSFERSYNLIPV